jgi:uncharacterized membrane protein HdeD (DUF308 family)
MRKLVLIVLSVLTLANLVVLVMALTQPTSSFYPYRMVIGLLLIANGGLLRRHILRYNEDSKGE